jgi:mono/diheme cytochrome c family protein
MNIPSRKALHVPPLALLLAGLCQPGTALADGAALVQEQCAGCHTLTAEAVTVTDLSERAVRKGPPLHFAGDKFRPEWLVAWLQAPKRLRPAGVMPADHVKPGANGDEPDPATLPDHPALDADAARQATDYLMTLTPHAERLAAITYAPGSIAAKMGEMNFGKFKGCDGCHRYAPAKGGLSGPELYTAWERLNPHFIVAFIQDPVAFDPHTLMPRAGLNDAEVAKLADFLKLAGEQQP